MTATLAERSQGLGFDSEALRSQFPGLRDPGLHYLDNAATAQMPQAVLDRLQRFEIEERANVHGAVHRRAVAALAAYEEARETLAQFLNAACPEEVVFTAGTTSALNLVAYAFSAGLEPGDEVVVSALEHHSNLVPWQQLAQRHGIVLRALPVTEDGRLDLAALDEVVRERCRLVAVTHCSNVTGALSDVTVIVGAARAVGARVLLDGAQRVPHGPVDVSALGVDFYAFSGHKMFGPTGIGVLWGRLDELDRLPPFQTGGQMIREVTLTEASFAEPPRRFEAGTPPIAGAIGLGAAARWMLALDWPAVIAHEVGLTRRLLDAVQTVRGAHVLGPLDLDNRRGVVSFAIDGVDSGELCRLADERGVAMRSGFHCAQPLHRALGFPGTARASVAPYNDLADIDAFCAGLENAMRRGGMRPVAAAQNGESAGCRAAVSRHDRREWENFPHGADVGVRGIGPTPAAAFEQAALALTAAVTEPDRVKPTTAVEIRCLAPDLEYLFVEWLNALVYEMDTRQMLFSRFSVHVDGEHLRAEAWGEPVDVVRHRPAAEVKGATMTALQVAQDADGRWHAQCVVDV